ncbi:hypothetical protein ACPWT1_19685 [Ramlibacter sp. MMS24-I3-19]|uniref:hypothetical protein n=1 Tax=Ramlibacter sp. MMS24-I3-19 TaxID=3416606 RepID=UPI003D01C80B
MQWLLSRVSRHPRGATIVGKALLLAGSILIVAAVFARAGLVNANAERAQAKLPPLHTVAEVYPQYPTWLVPEGPVGFTVAAVLVLAGMGLTLLAEKAGKRKRR